ncbi:hypothetical protein MPDQ_001685 [Monascus purpureus]|uniref:U4/U6.U5 small nuclear ribonucleoprotein 27kDa protein domain-containing protein n=1 Tax=Monascus purpureus TaxID=5098 RepID=A0A507QM26_MONPU|nr:hypothetical protein MPDQ_001685 [Monascus purpureus]BDD61767.1 hypothetical protein MAP00_006792 [Monascus purpureus]
MSTRRRDSVEPSPRPHPVSSPSRIAEPPAKRARRTDSSSMWEMHDKRTHSPGSESDPDRNARRTPYTKDGARELDDRRYRSRSRSLDRRERRRERSRSRDRRDRDRYRDKKERDRERSVSRDRHYRRGLPAKGDKFRDRSRSPFRNGTRDRTRSPPHRGSRTDRKDDRREGRPHERARHTNGRADSHHLSPARHRDQMDVDSAEVDGEEELEELIRKSMGFTKFRSTKNTKVPGNNIYGVRKEKKTEYRQYMNRTGGFNRPLSPTR